jgi:hypothetical protein
VVDEKTAVVARGIQMIGISLCLARNIPLERLPMLHRLGPDRDQGNRSRRSLPLPWVIGRSPASR